MRVDAKGSAAGRRDVDLSRLPMPNWPAQVYPGEPIYGWVHRAAAENYAFSVDRFVEGLGLNGRDWDYDALLEITEQLPFPEFAKLAWGTPKRLSGGFEVCGHQISEWLISKGRRRVCPACLSENRYIRVWFDLVPVNCCPSHDVLLVEGLPGDPIDWRNPEIGCTRSGIKICDEHATSKKSSELDRYAVDSLRGKDFPSPSHLEGERFNTVIHAAKCLGKLFRGDERNAAGRADYRRLAQSGFSALLRGREAVVDFICNAPWLGAEFEQRRYDAQCQYAPVFLKTVQSENLRNLISESFGLARVRSGRATPSGRLGKFDGEDGAWAMKAAANALQLRPDDLRRIFATLSIEPKKCPRTRTRRVTIDQIDAVKEYISASPSDHTVADRFGCTVSDVDELVNRKLVQMDFRCGGKRHFRETALAAFQDRILELPRSSSTIGSRSLYAFAQSSGHTLARSIAILVNGKEIQVSGYRVDLPFIHAIQVNECSAAQTPTERVPYRKAPVRPGAQVRNAITFGEAGARIGTGSAGLKELIERNFLGVEKDDRGQARICEKSLKLFEQSYARAAEFAPVLGCHPTSALKILRKAGVVPINDTGHETVKFVSRAEVERKAQLSLNGKTTIDELESLRVQIAKSLAENLMPATVRVVADPAITIRATTGKWSFHVRQQANKYELISHFRASRERGRLARIANTGIPASNIWPCAAVHEQAGGGFTLIDNVDEAGTSAQGRVLLAERCLARAHELHRIF